MRTLILAALLLPCIAFSQKSETYLSITDNNIPVKGTATKGGYEGFIAITSLQAEGISTKPTMRGTDQVTFSMPVSTASADLKRALFRGVALPRCEFTILSANNQDQILCKIKLEDIYVNSCSDEVGANGVLYTSVVLSASRIGWAYFGPGNAGPNTIIRKFGWDTMKNGEWPVY